jgi:hypothetical protein
MLRPEDDDFRKSFNAGLELAARLAESWADECCGGSGDYGEGYRNLAKSIRAKQSSLPCTSCIQ